MAIEKRILTAHTALRAESQGDELVLRGYAARFNVLSHPLNPPAAGCARPMGFREKIQPGAFKRSLAAGDDVICTFNHDTNKVLGRVRSGTLKLAEDDKGLAFRCQLDKNQQAHRDLHASVKRGDISDCSFAFSVPDGGDDFSDGKDENGQRCAVRTLRNVKLHDVSVVTHPAYPQTSVDARAAADRIVTRHHKREDLARAKRSALEYPELSLEVIARGLRLGYSEDVMLQLRFAEISKRTGFGFEVGLQSPRYQQGQSDDPTQSLRDDDDFDWDDDDQWDKDEHERCATFHRALARKADTWQKGAAQHAAADLHDKASRGGDSRAARAASKRLIFPDSMVS